MSKAVLAKSVAALAGAALATAVLAAPAAAAPRRVCAAAGADPVDVDGMLDDWDGVERIRTGGTAAEASFDLRCLFDGTRLFLAIDVRDEYVVRAGKTPAGEDRVELVLGTGTTPLTITLFPGKDRAAPRRLVGGKPAPKWLAVEDTLQPKGWSAELIVPLARVPGWGPSLPEVATAVRYLDADVAKLAMTEATVAWDGTLVLGNADSLHAQLLAELKLTPAQVTLDATADVDPTRPGPERVIAGGTAIALVTDVYGYVQLPVDRAADVLEVKLIELAGGGRRHVAARLRQRGGGGVRELLVIYTARGGKLEELRALELGKEHGGKRLRSTWGIESGKGWQTKAKGARHVLVVRAQPAVGWDEDSYAEAPAPDAEPIHVPWDDDRTGGVFWLAKDGTLATAPITRSGR